MDSCEALSESLTASESTHCEDKEQNEEPSGKALFADKVELLQVIKLYRALFRESARFTYENNLAPPCNTL